MLCSAVFAKRISIYFSSISISSGISESHFLCCTVCSLHRALCSQIPRETSCIKSDDCQQAFHGGVHQGPCQRNILPTQLCCSADLFTPWTCCRLHALIEAFESRGLFVSSLQQCLATQWYLLLSYLQITLLQQLPPKHTAEVLFVWDFKYNVYQRKST